MTPANPGDCIYTFAQDAYRDTSGVIHVMYVRYGTSTLYQYDGYHAVVQGGTTVLKNVSLVGVFCPDGSRIMQDSSGRFYVVSTCAPSLYVWPADMTDGTQLSAPTTLNMLSSNSSWLYLAVSRGGTALSNVLDIVWPGNNGAELDYYKVQLSNALP
jgi:hypothetical protein